MQVKTKKITKGRFHLADDLDNDIGQDILSAHGSLGRNLFSLLSSFLRLWCNLFDVLR